MQHFFFCNWLMDENICAPIRNQVGHGEEEDEERLQLHLQSEAF